MGQCTKCKTPHGHFNRCSYCHKVRTAEWYHRKNLRKYGLTAEDYENILRKQDDKCAICRKERKTVNRKWTFDHDHATGFFRGFLCITCNANLGWYEKFADSVKTYLCK